MAAVAILDFTGSKFLGQIYFRDVIMNPFAKYVQMCNYDWAIAINVNIKMVTAAILDFVGSKIWQ